MIIWEGQESTETKAVQKIRFDRGYAFLFQVFTAAALDLKHIDLYQPGESQCDSFGYLQLPMLRSKTNAIVMASST